MKSEENNGPVWCPGQRTMWSEMKRKGKHIQCAIVSLNRADKHTTIAIMDDGSKVAFDRNMLRRFNPTIGDTLDGWGLPHSNKRISVFYVAAEWWKISKPVYTKPKTAEEKQLEHLRERVKAVMRSI